jgi:hypothetical protein
VRPNDRSSIEPDPEQKGLPLSLDPDAESADDSLPTFLAPPPGAPAYHGFDVLDGIEIDGFGLGTISALGPADWGDAFVIAPDGSRAGIVWELGEADGSLREVLAFEPDRWGVWEVSFPRPMLSEDDARENFRAIVPALRVKWEEWKARHSTTDV